MDPRLLEQEIFEGAAVNGEQSLTAFLFVGCISYKYVYIHL